MWTDGRVGTTSSEKKWNKVENVFNPCLVLATTVISDIHSSMSHFFFKLTWRVCQKMSRTIKCCCARKLNTRNRWLWTITFHRSRTRRRCISFAKPTIERSQLLDFAQKKSRIHKRWIWRERIWMINFLLRSRSIRPLHVATISGSVRGLKTLWKSWMVFVLIFHVWKSYIH